MVLYKVRGQVKETWRDGQIPTAGGTLFNHRIQQWRTTTATRESP